jgi:hypothetical protein
MQRRRFINNFYNLIDSLRDRIRGYRRLSDCTGNMHWPQRGLYFFFEKGEYRANNRELRVVRVGTHALKTGSKTTLWNRLRTHRGPNKGKYIGGGNHRGSIFRLHVGTALLRRED